MEEGAVSSRSDARRTPVVVAAYLLLFLAAFIGLAPLFQVVAPLHASHLDAGAKTAILSRAMVWGAITAAGANILMGAISDRTRSRFGRRRPWIALGAVLTVLSYVGIWRSATADQFVWAIVGFQLAFNVLMAPLSAVFAERVPLALRSTASALMGLSYPLAVALGSSLMALGPQHEPGRLALLGGVLLAAAALFLIVYDEPAATERPQAGTPEPRGGFFDPFRSRNFVVVWTCRLLIATGYAFVSAYLLYFITDAVGWPGRTPESAHALLTGVGFGGVVIVAGLVALFGRRISRRQPVALVGAVLLCAATVALALTQSWIVVVIAFAAYGLGQGAYGSVEMGLMADALPSQENRGRDMGLNNLAVALPQALAPITALILERAEIDVRGLYIAAAACFAAAVVVVGLFRRES
ncbi:Major Facilitator Superfamily protein [Brevundimonas sp. SH203]|uniref:MFS transporter n=1 Tax=Brevundimonas sp. SH203 TaxID=345167 RepID=UPI0009C5286D|nr:MFS transporter [Brevundimonas sp. SH203]GAW41474.1 Major Facilitator Superfamily protein [Brevundimonas sp. SH203]